MHMLHEAYVVSDVRALDQDGVAAPVPPEVRERFEGRAFTKPELEQRGVRMAGDTGWFMAQGRDFQLKVRLAPWPWCAALARRASGTIDSMPLAPWTENPSKVLMVS